MSNQDSGRYKSSIRVLVVDDQKTTRYLFKEYISSASDLEVVGLACNGKEGVEQVMALQPDIVLMDINMPDMDGIVATKMLRNCKSNVKVLVVSSSYDDCNLAKALNNGASGYLLKTTTPSEVVAAIRGVHSGSLQFSLSNPALGGPISSKLVDREAASPIKRNRTPTTTIDDKSVSLSRAKKVAFSPSISDLELELSRIRAHYWVLRTEQKTLRRNFQVLCSLGLAITFLFMTLYLLSAL